MATIPQTEQMLVPARRSDSELVAELHGIFEGVFDEMGLTDAERDERYDSLESHLISNDVSRAKS